jgi:hypothetical protein
LGWIRWIWMNDDECLSSLMSLIIHSFSEVEKKPKCIPTCSNHSCAWHPCFPALGCLDGHIHRLPTRRKYLGWGLAFLDMLWYHK